MFKLDFQKYLAISRLDFREYLAMEFQVGFSGIFINVQAGF